MADETVWDDSARDQLRETLRWSILGELRLHRLDHETILENCREVYMPDECPEDEQEEFLCFAADELARVEAQLAAEGAGWPEETDCDRLDRVEAALRERGIMLWQASPCCDTCTRSELGERLAELEPRHPGFCDRVRGYAFFIDQNLPDKLADGTRISVYLGYGWFRAGDAEVAPDEDERRTLAIAAEVCECLREEGFEPEWGGDASRKIGVALDWRRRTMLN